MTTEQGKQAIGKVHVGDKVWAYNSRTHTMEWQPIVHVWIHQDNDLIDLTITTQIKIHHGSSTTTVQKSEIVHTNQKHPFLTVERGFLPVGQIKVGMHILRADTHSGTIIQWKIVPGPQVMYNLEVAQDHTFTVGEGQWVVHNCDLTITGTQYSQDELSAAKYVASIMNEPGDSVTLRDPGSNRGPDGDTSDLLVNGVNYDIITPESGTSISRILSNAAGKYTQARGVVINLSNTGLNASDLGRNPLGRIQGLLSSWGVSPSAIQNVIIYNP